MNELEYYRKQKGYSFRKMAELCDIDTSTYFDYEKSRRIPNVINALKIADVLGVSVETLFVYCANNEKMLCVSCNDCGYRDCPAG